MCRLTLTETSADINVGGEVTVVLFDFSAEVKLWVCLMLKLWNRQG